ncbi:MAG: acyloxyacyl hydrolase [Gammaproteobacteria bacterium]
MSNANEADWLQVGVRSGVGETGNGFDMKQYEIYGLYRLPWGHRWSPNAALTTRLDGTFGGLEHQEETGLIATLSPTIAMGLARNRISLNGGVGAALLSERRFQKINFGGNFQFRLHAGADVNLARRISAGYRFQHMSNANTFETNPGLNLHMVEFAYRF